MIKNVIFDWSGTLSDDLVSVYTAVMEIFKKLGLEVLTLEEFKKEFTLPYMKFYRKFEKNVSKEELQELYSREIELVDKPKPFPEAREILEFLKQREIKMVLLSVYLRKQLNEEIEHYKFQNFFADVNGSIYDKTEVVIKIMQKNNFKCEETIFVGDMTHDVDAGKKAGVKTVAISQGYQSKEKLLEKNPDFLIENLRELKDIVLLA